MPDDLYGDRYVTALERAATWHGDHGKKGSGVPYISHLLTVSALVWEDGGTETEAIAGLLHDTVEDGKASLDTVRREFGDEVAAIVDDCSDAAPESGQAKAPWFERKVHHVLDLREVGELDRAPSTMRVVGADKLANVRSLLVDERGDASGLWARFKGGLGGSAWYYREMADLVGRVLPGSMLARELYLAVDRLEQAMAETAGNLDGADTRIASVLGDAVVSGDIDATRYLAFELARSASAAANGAGVAVGTVLLNWLGQPPERGGRPTRDDLGIHGELHDRVVASLST